jgi:hypothetical protein
MFHGHIEALLKHRCIKTTISPWPNFLIGSTLMIITLQSFHLKSLFLTVENSHILSVHCLSCLLKCARTSLTNCTKLVLRFRTIFNCKNFIFSILARTWNIKFKAGSKEYLIISKSIYCLVKTNIFTRINFIIRCSSFWSPLCPRVFEIILYSIKSFQFVYLTSL